MENKQEALNRIDPVTGEILHHKPDEFRIFPDHTHQGSMKDLRSSNLKLTFALAGNQNTGKTTLFNYLTGSNQHVGNWPGVTVEHKDGTVKQYPGITIVDLPGIYSLSPYSDEEIVTRNYLVDEKPDGIINIVDVSNLERNLYLTLQMAELGIPMIIALNMMDELEKNGDVIDIKGLEEDLGIPIVPITARDGKGVDDLMENAIEIAIKNKVPPLRDICDGAVHRAIHSIAYLIQDHAEYQHYSPRYIATKLIEGDPLIKDVLGMSEGEMHIIDHIVENMETEIGMDREAAIADSRYQFITRVSAANLKRNRKPGELTLSNRIDKVFTNKYLALPVFAALMALVFYIAFGPIGSFISDGFTGLIDAGIAKAAEGLDLYGVAPWVRSLIIDGVLAGVGSVLSFLPVILILFGCISVLEDCGYMARAAFIMDKALCKLGLTGRSFIPLIMGFGCSVPAIMGARTLDNPKDRRMTVFLIPFMSCGAKIPVYTLFIAAFFSKGKTGIMFAYYILGMLIAVLYGLILRKTIFKGEPAPFIIELPPYRLPTMKNVFRSLWDKAKDFVERATTIILAATVVIWFLQNMDPHLYWVENNAESILAGIGGFLAPVFKPLGFGTWQSVTALMTGLLAKESVLSTMNILYNGNPGMAFTTLSAVSFLTFFLLYPPCFAAISVTKKELGTRWAILGIALQLIIAWVVTFAVYHIGALLI